MVTRLYFHSITNNLSNLPTTEQNPSLAYDKNADAQAVNRQMDTVIGTGQTSIVLASNATVSLQRNYFTRFVSQPLSGVSTITAQTWTYNIGYTESNVLANFPVSTSGAFRFAMIYVWRPGTGKVGDICDGVGTGSVTEGAAGSQRTAVLTFSGSAVSGVQDGDVICSEIWCENTQGAATSYNLTFFYDGTIITLTNTSSSDNASFIETPQDLTFKNGRLYFHAATNPLSNLPTTEQSSLTADKTADALSVNRLMDNNIGTSQTSIALVTNTVGTLQRNYYTRFVSPPLSGITSIIACGWNYNLALMESASAAQFPSNVSNSPVRIMAYVWRPSTQTKVGDILDGNSLSQNDEASATVIKSYHTGFIGSSVASVQNGDVICFEVWFEITGGAAGGYTDTFYYDGTTVQLTSGTTVTNHASFIETSQVLVFAGAAPIDCTVTGKTLYNKTTSHA